MANGDTPTTSSGIPHAIKQDKPQMTLDMPGPLGNEVRRAAASKQAEQDRQTARTRQAKLPTDNRNTKDVSLTDNMRAGDKGVLRQAFQRENGRAVAAFSRTQSTRTRGR